MSIDNLAQRLMDSPGQWSKIDESRATDSALADLNAQAPRTRGNSRFEISRDDAGAPWARFANADTDIAESLQ